MTDKERDRIENAIRHIQTAADVDPWAVKIAVEAMEKQIPKKPDEIIDKSWGIPKRQGVCPECGHYLGRVYFIDTGTKGKHITYCETCGQAIDWKGWEQDD